ncbi:dynamin family protein [Mycobacterium sp. 852002-51057_SCH5723018]|uniref:dynamin family protein n=1 Tax=Mycobacterium sp. 852002-51057_SCH5723018 TaxID=1834094 RepID=UPI000AA6DB55|nr:dynamin family protein [Mycobacterium sp. 852002-51057_SCH5723018]
MGDRIEALAADLGTVYTNHEIQLALRQLPSATTQPADRAKIVFVGEVGAGKTALINAVLGRADLPVLPTKQPFAVGGGSPEHVRLGLVDGRTETVGVEELASVTVQRDPADVAVDFVEVVIDHPMLAEVTLFDTPGVGGLDPTTTSMTLAALEGAAALVFVCAAGEKLSLAAAGFLVEAASCIDHVVFVLSKVDNTDDGGTANLEENIAVIKKRLPPDQVRGLTFLAVSAELAAEAALGDAESLAESGIEPLRAVLREIAASQHVHTQRNALRQIKQSLATAYGALAQRRSVLKERTGEAEGLDVVTGRLSTLRQHRGAWQTLMYRLMSEAEWAAQDARKQRAKELDREYADRAVAANARDDFAALEAQIVHDLREWQQDTVAEVHRRVEELAENLIQGLFFVDIDALTHHMAAPGSSAADCLAEATRTARNGANAMAALQQSYLATMMANNIGNAVAHTIGIAAGVTLGPMMLPGLGWYLLQRFFRIQAQKRDDLARRVRDAISEATELISTDTLRRFERLKWKLRDAIDEAVDAAIAEAEEQRKAIGQADVDRHKHIDKLALSLGPLRGRWNALHAELLALTGPQPTP